MSAAPSIITTSLETLKLLTMQAMRINTGNVRAAASDAFNATRDASATTEDH